MLGITPGEDSSLDLCANFFADKTSTIYYFYQLVVLPHKNPECINPLKRRDQLCSVSAVMARVTMFPQNAMPMVSCGHHLSQCLIDPIMGKGAIADTTSYSTVCQPY